MEQQPQTVPPSTTTSTKEKVKAINNSQFAIAVVLIGIILISLAATIYVLYTNKSSKTEATNEASNQEEESDNQEQNPSEQPDAQEEEKQEENKDANPESVAYSSPNMDFTIETPATITVQEPIPNCATFTIQENGQMVANMSIGYNDNNTGNYCFRTGYGAGNLSNSSYDLDIDGQTITGQRTIFTSSDPMTPSDETYTYFIVNPNFQNFGIQYNIVTPNGTSYLDMLEEIAGSFTWN